MYLGVEIYTFVIIIVFLFKAYLTYKKGMHLYYRHFILHNSKYKIYSSIDFLVIKYCNSKTKHFKIHTEIIYCLAVTNIVKIASYHEKLTVFDDIKSQHFF